ARPTLSLALLAADSAQGPIYHLRSELVRPRAGGTHREALLRSRLDAGLRGDQRVRRATDAERYRGLQVLAADLQGRAARALQGAREDSFQAFQDYRRGLAQPEEVERLPDRGGGHDRAHQYGTRALDAHRGQRQIPRPRQGGAHGSHRSRQTPEGGRITLQAE